MNDLLHLNFRRRIAALVWGRWLIFPAGIAVMAVWRNSAGSIFTVIAGAMLWVALTAWETSARRQFVREAGLPRFLLTKLRTAYPQLEQRDAELVLRGLRQFFMAHLRSGRKFVSMPSKVVDHAWHEFILHTEAYQRWCAAAFGGPLHHTPAEVLGLHARRNDGLRRAWYWACKEESIEPRWPTRLPLLFALDRKFAIAGGFSYVPDCKAIDKQSESGAYCGSDFGDSAGGSGDSHGFGGSETSSSTGFSIDSDGGDSGGCGGGCGGGD